MHFDQAPGVWFDQPGRFSVRIGGVAAALAGSVEQPRIASNRLAGPELGDGAVELTLLEHDPRRFHHSVRVEIAMVELDGNVPDTDNAAAVDVRAQFELSPAGASGFVVVNNTPIDPVRVLMLRLQPVDPGVPFFPGAVIEIAGGTPAAVLAVEDADGVRARFPARRTGSAYSCHSGQRRSLVLCQPRRQLFRGADSRSRPSRCLCNHRRGGAHRAAGAPAHAGAGCGMAATCAAAPSPNRCCASPMRLGGDRWFYTVGMC